MSYFTHTHTHTHAYTAGGGGDSREEKKGKMTKKMSNKERMEWKSLQGNIDKLTKKRDELDSKLAKGNGDFEELGRYSVYLLYWYTSTNTDT